MAKGSRRGGRVRDKWRDKQWIIVNAPPAFEQVPLNYIPISDINTAKGRVIENTLYDMGLNKILLNIKQKSLFK